jgi:F0F1-type ATP synthase membrane subunit b/b'
VAIARMKRDLQSKLEGEKKEMIDEMNHEMVSGLIAKTKNDIANNADKRKSTTSKLMTGLN